MTQLVPAYFHELAEALCPLSHSLAAGLLIRPVSVAVSEAIEEAKTSSPDALASLCRDLDALLTSAVADMRAVLTDMESNTEDDLEELVDELASPALDLVDMARKIWAAPLPPEAESARPLLATLAEAPVAQLLQWILEITHMVIDPWAVTEDPEHPATTYQLHVRDAPVREALALWRIQHPGVLPDDVLQ